MRYSVILEQDPSGMLVAHVPALRGCVSQGRTKREAPPGGKQPPSYSPRAAPGSLAPFTGLSAAGGLRPALSRAGQATPPLSSSSLARFNGLSSVIARASQKSN